MASRDEEARAEHRWPALIGLVVALTLYATLPTGFFLPLRFAVVGLGVLLLIPLIAVNPVRMRHEKAWSKWMSRSLSILLLAANQVALVQLIIALVTSSDISPYELILAALQVWVTNAIMFALIFWDFDRGGPVERNQAKRKDLPAADFRFPQDEDEDAVLEVRARSSAKLDWTPNFFDYLYVSLTNSMAFSPADTMPLSQRFKALMVIEAFSAFVIVALVIARAVALFG